MPQKKKKSGTDMILGTLADMNQAIGSRFDRVDNQLGDLQSQVTRIESLERRIAA